MIRNFLLACLSMLCVVQMSWAQTRYLDPVFAEVARQDTVPYGQNYTVFRAPGDTVTQIPYIRPLFMDVYTPVGDTASSRPLVLLCATGNFLPMPLNGGPYGTIKDSAVVEMANRLAERGYVVAVFDYRKGWDFLNPIQEIQTATLLQAAYRGIQDARACIRFFRKTVAEDSNPYGIDPDRIAVGGFGTGGYISLGSGYLDDFNKVLLPKFIDPNNGMPYIDTTFHGNVNGTNTATANFPNWPDYSSDYNVNFNLGGALGDSSWIDPGDMPSIGFHTPLDPNAPYDIGIVIVPTTGNTVIDQAAGSRAVTAINDDFGNNQVFIDAGFNDVYTQRANEINEGIEGLFPFDRPFTPGNLDCNGGQFPLVPEGDPWNWYNEPVFIATWNAVLGGGGADQNCSQLAANQDQSATKGRTYMDSVMGYLAPRLAEVLVNDSSSVSIDDDILADQIQLYPNPAFDQIFISNTNRDNFIREVRVMDLAGRILIQEQGLNQSQFILQRGNLPTGMYLIQISALKGMTTKRVMFR
ncbi:T9SS type A sorting domain-containing protein [Pontibacter sp. G13]|uniref:T9SS type A sorting domain-containing protein n=1 Tax=Pontibacter sp. G13 TaxID=3074898 RepID=UPI00288B7009|nr:T9SS type A sorting domain-containing protein [Pontibacter sp. G13]WNJ20971.1 T9SS type A sorting domain-containing protein [Pontibacter sp. G13]